MLALSDLSAFDPLHYTPGVCRFLERAFNMDISSHIGELIRWVSLLRVAASCGECWKVCSFDERSGSRLEIFPAISIGASPVCLVSALATGELSFVGRPETCPSCSSILLMHLLTNLSDGLCTCECDPKQCMLHAVLSDQVC